MDRPTADVALAAREVSKRFGPVVALDRVSLEVRRGRMRRADRRERLGEDDAAALLQPADRSGRGHRAGRRRRRRRRSIPSRCAGAWATCRRTAGCSRTGACAATSRWCPGSAAWRTRRRCADRGAALVGLEPARWRPLAARAVRRPAPARRRGPRAGREPGRDPARRAVRRARRHHPRRAAGHVRSSCGASSASPTCW